MLNSSNENYFYYEILCLYFNEFKLFNHLKREIGQKCLKNLKNILKMSKMQRNASKKFYGYNMEYLKHICSLEFIV